MWYSECLLWENLQIWVSSLQWALINFYNCVPCRMALAIMVLHLVRSVSHAFSSSMPIGVRDTFLFSFLSVFVPPIRRTTRLSFHQVRPSDGGILGRPLDLKVICQYLNKQQGKKRYPTALRVSPFRQRLGEIAVYKQSEWRETTATASFLLSDYASQIYE